MSRDDFISDYLQYQAETEPPKFFHRWCVLSMLGAYLGRDFTSDLGAFKITPNMYTMLIGVPGTRKSTAIKLSKKLLKLTSYDKFSADKSSKEKFLLDLAGDSLDGGHDLLEDALFGGDDDTRNSQVYIACDEFNNFIGNGNIEFVSLLGELWDYEGTYSNRIKSGKSVNIPNPTVSILGGNTATGFSLAFPSTTIGQGFFSRLLLVYSEPSNRKITFPKAPDPEQTSYLVDKLLAMKSCVQGTATYTDSANMLLDKIYKNTPPIEDSRFEHYTNRRFTHLLKLCLIVAASRMSTEIAEEDVVYANTILHHTEQLMPKALGEFGKSKNSDVTHKIIQILENHYEVLSIQQIWAYVSQDLEKLTDLGNIMGGLATAGKVIGTKGGFLAKRKAVEARFDDAVDYSLLTDEEIGPIVRSEPKLVIL